MSITQGAALPDITKTLTKTDTAPEYYTNYLSGLSAAGKTAMDRKPGDAIAGYNPLQDTGYAALPAAATAYTTGLGEADKTLETASKGVTADRIRALMNPYQDEVVNEMERLQQQALQRSILPTMKAGFVGTGGLGGQRYANALGQTMSDAQRNLLGQQQVSLQSGYSDALKTALGELSPMVQAGQAQGNLAKMEQELGLTGAGALTKAGAEKQKYEQSLLDYPLKSAMDAAALLRQYQVPISQKTTDVGPGTQGQYQQSDLQSIMGVLSLLGSAATGASGDAAKGAGLNEVMKWAKGLLGNVSTTPVFVGNDANGNPLWFKDGQYRDDNNNVVPVDWGADDSGEA